MHNRTTVELIITSPKATSRVRVSATGPARQAIVDVATAAHLLSMTTTTVAARLVATARVAMTIVGALLHHVATTTNLAKTAMGRHAAVHRWTTTLHHHVAAIQMIATALHHHHAATEASLTVT